MSVLLGIYSLAIVASVVLGAALALLGVHLAARDRAMQTLCVGQGAMLGVLLGLGISHLLVGIADERLSRLTQLDHADGSLVPFVLANIAAAATLWASEALVSRRSASRNTHFTALFVTLLAGGYLVSALFPALENHMAQKFFGDLATLGQTEAWSALAVGAALMAILVAASRPVSRDSFATAILGERPQSRVSGRLFAVLTLLVLCFAVQTVGFLFTVACLFLPTAVLSADRRLGLRRHLTATAATAAIGAAAGFLTSLYFSGVPTTPAIVVAIGMIAAAGHLGDRLLGAPLSSAGTTPAAPPATEPPPHYQES